MKLKELKQLEAQTKRDIEKLKSFVSVSNAFFKNRVFIKMLNSELLSNAKIFLKSIRRKIKLQESKK